MSEHFIDPYKKAKELGLDVVLPEDNQLQLDIDSTEDHVFMQHMLNILDSNNAEYVIDKETTSHGGNKHVYISLNRQLTPLERVAFQACLGSDRKRELLSLLAVFQGQQGPPSVMFEVPAQKLLAAPIEENPIEDEWVALFEDEEKAA